MGFFDESLFQTDAPSARVPDGEYLLEIKNVAVKVKDWAAKDTQFKWEFTIREGISGMGQTLRMTTTLKPGAQFSLGRLLTAVNFDIAKIAATEIPEKEGPGTAALEKLAEKLAKTLRGQAFGALVVESKPDGDGRRYSNIQETYPTEDYPERSKSNVGRSATVSERSPAANAEVVEDLASEIDAW